MVRLLVNIKNIRALFLVFLLNNHGRIQDDEGGGYKRIFQGGDKKIKIHKKFVYIHFYYVFTSQTNFSGGYQTPFPSPFEMASPFELKCRIVIRIFDKIEYLVKILDLQ